MSRKKRGGCALGCLVAWLVVVCAVAVAGLVGSYLYEPRTHYRPDRGHSRAAFWGENVQREVEPPDTTLPDRTAQVHERREQNGDTVGWLYIPDTGIDDPVHFTPGTNNLYNRYLHHNMDGESDARGALFADARSRFGQGTRSELAPLFALYAHSFREDPAHDSPFSPLKYYRDESFAREHPYLYFSTWEENMAFEVVAVFEAHVNLPYNHGEQSVAAFERMLDAVSRSSLYDYGARISQTDRLLVLSTCAMTVQGHDDLDPSATEYRFAVMGRLVPPGAATKTEAEFAVNQSPAPPDDFLHMGYN